MKYDERDIVDSIRTLRDILVKMGRNIYAGAVSLVGTGTISSAGHTILSAVVTLTGVGILVAKGFISILFSITLKASREWRIKSISTSGWTDGWTIECLAGREWRVRNG